MEAISWDDTIRNEKVFRRVEEERRIFESIKKKKKNCDGYCI